MRNDNPGRNGNQCKMIFRVEGINHYEISMIFYMNLEETGIAIPFNALKR